jgi:predicted deacylase
MPSLSPGHPLSADPGAWRDPVICSSSHWIFTRTGGILYVVPPVFSWVRKGDILADVRSVFGHCVQRYFAPCDGIVVGKSDNPVCHNGDRIVHLGVVGGDLEDATDDGHP